MKIGLGQINTIVGDLEGNTQKIIESYEKLSNDGADMVVFPELTLCSYPPKDLLLKKSFILDNKAFMEQVAKSIGNVPALIGFVDSDELSPTSSPYNAAAWCHKGEIVHVARKCLLPTYGVFDEERYFATAPKPTIFPWEGKRIAITICEDIWTDPSIEVCKHRECDPVAMIAEEKVDIMLNLSSSPWHHEKTEIRDSLVSATARRCQCPVVYCNQVGGNDELIFDGRSLVSNANGDILATLPAFQESLTIVDLKNPPETPTSQPKSKIEDIHDALVLGLRDYVQKTGFKQALIGVSGGIDSAVVAALAAEALGADNVMGISLPSAISSDHSKEDAKQLALNLGIQYNTVEIQSSVDSSLNALSDLFKGKPCDITEENIQARTRGLLLMAISNKYKNILLSTGNKSELAVGYCTLYGDMAGGLGVIADLTKTRVYELAAFINRDKKIIPQNSIDKAPSAELSPGQTDQDTLPPYPVLDRILNLYIEKGYGIKEIIEEGFDKNIVEDAIHRVDYNEYKRNQAAPILRVTPLAFGVGRRMPIAQKYAH